jgi:hypothetical protein
VTIAGAGHCPQYENALVWAAAVEEHLSNYSRRTALLS